MIDRPTASCPVCGNAAELRYSCKNRNILRCQSRTCKLRFIDPQPNDDELARYYTQDYYGSEKPKYSETEARLYAQIAANVLPLSPARKPVLLDYGCGRAGFWEVLSADLKTCYCAVERDPVSRKDASLKTGRPVASTLKELLDQTAQTWDICIMNQAVEHLRDPLAKLRELLACASTGAILFLATPNAASARAVLRRGNWSEYLNRTHLHFLCPKSCIRLLNKAGFVDCRRVKFPLSYTKSGCLRNILQRVLRRTGLDGNLTFIARHSGSTQDRK